MAAKWFFGLQEQSLLERIQNPSKTHIDRTGGLLCVYAEPITRTAIVWPFRFTLHAAECSVVLSVRWYCVCRVVRSRLYLQTPRSDGVRECSVEIGRASYAAFALLTSHASFQIVPGPVGQD